MTNSATRPPNRRCFRLAILTISIANSPRGLGDRRNGVRLAFTLLEAMVGMALLGTILASMLVAYSRYAHQTQRAAERMNIMREAEALLIGWYIRTGFVPVEEDGELAVGENTYRWRTRPVERVLDETFMIGVIRFEVTPINEKTPLVSLELIVPSWGES